MPDAAPLPDTGVPAAPPEVALAPAAAFVVSDTFDRLVGLPAVVADFDVFAAALGAAALFTDDADFAAGALFAFVRGVEVTALFTFSFAGAFVATAVDFPTDLARVPPAGARAEVARPVAALARRLAPSVSMRLAGTRDAARPRVAPLERREEVADPVPVAVAVTLPVRPAVLTGGCRFVAERDASDLAAGVMWSLLSAWHGPRRAGDGDERESRRP
jgi:hypothetical protein